MPYKLFWETQGVVIVYTGHVSIGEVVEAIDQYHGDERFDELRYAIIDTLNITSTSITADHLVAVWSKDLGAEYSNPMLIKAFISTFPPLIEFAETYRNAPIRAYELEVFNNEHDARRWISKVIKKY